MDNHPKLIDPHSLQYFHEILKKTHETRTKYHSIMLNIIILAVILAVFAGCIYYKYKTKRTPEQDRYKLMKEYDYVLSRIRFFQEQEQKMKQSANLITNLPDVEPRGFYDSVPIAGPPPPRSGKTGQPEIDEYLFS